MPDPERNRFLRRAKEIATQKERDIMGNRPPTAKELEEMIRKAYQPTELDYPPTESDLEEKIEGDQPKGPKA